MGRRREAVDEDRLITGRHQENLNGWQWASGIVRLQPGTWLPRTCGLAENRLEWSGKLETYTESVESVGPDGQGSSGRHVRSRMARLAVGQRQCADRTGAGLAATEWPPSGAGGLGLSERRAGSGLGSGRGKNLKLMSSASGRSDRSGPGRPATTRAEPDGAAGGGSAATRGPDGGGPRCDGMAAVRSGGHAQAVPQFSMPVSCRGQLLAGGQTASECSDGKRDRHGPRPARDREWVGPLAAGGGKRGPGGSYHCSGMDAAGVAAVCQPAGSQRD